MDKTFKCCFSLKRHHSAHTYTHTHFMYLSFLMLAFLMPLKDMLSTITFLKNIPLCECSACRYVCATCVYNTMLQRPKEGMECPGIGVLDNCELPFECPENKPSPLQKSPRFLKAESFLRPPGIVFLTSPLSFALRQIFFPVSSN